MRKVKGVTAVTAATAGLLVVLAGTASAATPAGNAYGNCKNSAAGGKVVGSGGVDNGHGLGGHSRADTSCLPQPTAVEPSTPSVPTDPPSGPTNS